MAVMEIEEAYGLVDQQMAEIGQLTRQKTLPKPYLAARLSGPGSQLEFRYELEALDRR